MFLYDDSPAIVDIAYEGPFQIPLTSRSVINIAISIPQSEIEIEPIIQNIEYDDKLVCHEVLE